MSLVQIWRQAFDQIIVAVLIFQLLMIGLVGLKKAPIQAGLLVPLPFITVAFRCDFISWSFANRSQI